LCALKAIELLGLYEYEPVARGLSHTRLPGRFQVETVRQKTCVFDVGHNVHAIEGLVKTIAEVFPEKSVCFVAGIMRDKDTASMIRALASHAVSMILTRPATDRAASADDLAAQVPDGFGGRKYVREKVREAVDCGLAGPWDVCCVTGSFYTVGEAMEHLEIEPYPAAVACGESG
jgi:dihydrofolate synthase/folylpolyglutamate synthase